MYNLRLDYETKYNADTSGGVFFPDNPLQVIKTVCMWRRGNDIAKEIGKEVEVDEGFRADGLRLGFGFVVVVLIVGHLGH